MRPLEVFILDYDKKEEGRLQRRLKYGGIYTIIIYLALYMVGKSKGNKQVNKNAAKELRF